MWLKSKALALLIASAPAFDAARAQGVHVEPVKDQAANSPKEALRKKIFAKDLAKTACLPVKVDPRGVTGLDGTLDAFLKEAIAAIKGRDKLKLQPLFHPRMNVDLPAIDETFARLGNVYGVPFDVSALRLWALNTVDGAPGSLPCAGDDLAVSALYGYPLQFGAWLQIMGPKELGRIFVSVVPVEGKWHLGSFHAQQWTHASKDGVTWAKDAALAAEKGLKEGAFLKYDIAAKLLDGGNFIDIAAKDQAAKARDAVMVRKDWEASVREVANGFDVIYVASLLVVDGAGILLRIRIPEEISVERIKTQCLQLTQKFSAQPWGREVGGIRCSFNLPKEDPSKDGALGGIYMGLRDGK